MPMTPLPGKKNPFGGMHIDAAALPESPEEFSAGLTRSLAAWQEDACKVVWLPIPIECSHLIPLATREGFQFHHTEGGTLVLVKPLQPDAFIYPYASHSIGVGAVVLSPNEQILVVQERYLQKSHPGYYKLPGGLADPGEYIVDAAAREVREETGIEARFDALVCARHHHRAQFGTSNIYFICRMHPLTMDITIDPEEIAEARWMSVAEYLALETVGEFNKRVVELALRHRPLASEQITHEPFGPYELLLPAEHPLEGA
jgi:8-oxo-dGTP pyrophosphatase MutT (NUDIX family)